MATIVPRVESGGNSVEAMVILMPLETSAMYHGCIVRGALGCVDLCGSVPNCAPIIPA